MCLMYTTSGGGTFTPAAAVVDDDAATAVFNLNFRITSCNNLESSLL